MNKHTLLLDVQEKGKQNNFGNNRFVFSRIGGPPFPRIKTILRRWLAEYLQCASDKKRRRRFDWSFRESLWRRVCESFQLLSNPLNGSIPLPTPSFKPWTREEVCRVLTRDWSEVERRFRWKGRFSNLPR